MKLQPTDSGRKVTCKIEGIQINDGELYYCPEEKEYYIFQDEKDGVHPESLSPEEKGYKNSWCYFDLSENWISPDVTDFKFK